jgi:hypothetical protein
MHRKELGNLSHTMHKNLLSDIGLGNDALGYDPKSTGNKSKKRQLKFYQTKKLQY